MARRLFGELNEICSASIMKRENQKFVRIQWFCQTTASTRKTFFDAIRQTLHTWTDIWLRSWRHFLFVSLTTRKAFNLFDIKKVALELYYFVFLFQGKGTVVTYFLAGYDGFNKTLPDLKFAASLEEHSFKWRER